MYEVMQEDHRQRRSPKANLVQTSISFGLVFGESPSFQWLDRASLLSFRGRSGNYIRLRYSPGLLDLQLVNQPID